MCRKNFIFALLAILAGVTVSFVSAEIVTDYSSGNEIIDSGHIERPEETEYESESPDEAKYQTSLQYEELDEDVEASEEKQDLLQYEEPDEFHMENPFDLIQSFFSQVFGLTPKKIFMTMLHAVTYFIAVLIFGLSAVTYSI